MACSNLPTECINHSHIVRSSNLTSPLSISLPFAEHYLRLGNRVAEERAVFYALPCYRKALELDPFCEDARILLAKGLRRCRFFAEAEQVIKQGLQLNPGSKRLFSHMGNILETDHRLDDLATFLSQYGRQEMAGKSVFLRLSGRLQWRKQNLELASRFVSQAIEVSDDVDDLVAGYYLLAQIKQDQGDFDAAFHFVKSANDTLLKTKNHQLTKGNVFKSLLVQLKPFVQRCKIPVKANTGQNSPVFLAGFPRSGTTLMGQILNAHPRLNTADEHDSLPTVIRELKYTGILYPTSGVDELLKIDNAAVERLQKKYYQQMQLDGRYCNVDKTPFNFIHLPLIWRLFPNAKMIVMIRDPLDVCLSCYFQQFSLNASSQNFLELDSIADTYCAAMALLKPVLERQEHNDYAAVQLIFYERLVADFTSVVRDALRFLNLTWHNDLYHFYQKSRTQHKVQTPSYHQVIKPVFQDGVGRWTLYKEHLRNIVPRLAPWRNYFSYSKNPVDIS